MERLREALAVGSPSLSYGEMTAESLLLQNVAHGSSYAHDQLAYLAEDTRRAADIRETLYVGLLTGSQIKASVELGIHENTVRLRLTAIAGILGEDYLNRRTELLMALRIIRSLGAAKIDQQTASGVDSW